MANSPGTLAGEIIIRRAFRLVFTKFPKIRQFAMGFKELDGSVAAANLGQTVRSRKKAIPTVGNFGDAPTAYSATDISGVLSNWAQVMHKFNPEEIQTTDRNLIEESAEGMAVAVAKEITRRQAALICNANFNSTVNGQLPYVSVASGWNRANTIVPMEKALNERGVPDEGRFFFFNSDVNAAFQQDQLIVTEWASADNKGRIASGNLGVVSGMQLDKYIQMPNTDGNLVGFAGVNDALCYMARAPKNPVDLIAGLPNPSLMAVITDEGSGFSCVVQQWFNSDTWEVNTRIVWLDGMSVGNDTCLVRLINGVIPGSSGTLVGVTVTNAGYAYRTGAAGNAYTAPTVAFSGGGGSSAAGTATISNNGAVTAVGSLTAGSGYTSAPAIAFNPASSGTKAGPATAVASIGGLN